MRINQFTPWQVVVGGCAASLCVDCGDGDLLSIYAMGSLWHHSLRRRKIYFSAYWCNASLSRLRLECPRPACG